MNVQFQDEKCLIISTKDLVVPPFIGAAFAISDEKKKNTQVYRIIDVIFVDYRPVDFYLVKMQWVGEEPYLRIV